MYVCMSVLAIPICGLKQDKAFPRKVSPVPELKALAHWDQSKVLKCDCESVNQLKFLIIRSIYGTNLLK